MMQKCCPKKCEEKRVCKWEDKDHCKWDKKDECECHEEEKKCCRKCDEFGKAMLKCVNGNSIASALSITIPALGTAQPYFLGSISVDEKNLCNPKTVLTFSATLQTVVGIALLGTSNINVYRTCRGEKQLIASIPVLPAISVLDVKNVSFQVCAESDCCKDCVNYSFDFVPGTQPAVAVTVAASISNVKISALTIEKEC